MSAAPFMLILSVAKKSEWHGADRLPVVPVAQAAVDVFGNIVTDILDRAVAHRDIKARGVRAAVGKSAIVETSAVALGGEISAAVCPANRIAIVGREWPLVVAE